MKHTFLVIGFSGIAGALFAMHPDSCMYRYHELYSPERYYNNFFSNNPAALYSVPVTDYKSFDVSYGTSNADNGFYLQHDGDGGNNLSIQSESFQRDCNYSFFGQVKYERNLRTHTGWTDVEDYDLLYPYIVADSVGGDYKKEVYALSGGFSLHRNSWEYALRASYDGSVAYRYVDPRPRNTVSVININPGIVYSDENIQAGFFANYIRYRQNVDISIEKEDRKVYFYLLQGFGIYNRQFSGLEDAYTRIYKGNIYSAGFHLNQTGHIRGVLLKVYRAEIDVNEDDRRVPYKLAHNTIDGEITNDVILGNNKLLMKGSYIYHQVIGNETQYYPSVINTNYTVWSPITSSDRYQSQNQDGALALLLTTRQKKKFSLWEEVKLNWNSNKSNYYTPDYLQFIENVSGYGRIGFDLSMKKSWLSGNITGGYQKNLSSTLNQTENSIVTAYQVIPDFEYLITDYALYGFDVAYRFRSARKLFANLALDANYRLANEGKSFFSTTFKFSLNY